MLNEYKEKKLAEFVNEFVIHCSDGDILGKSKDGEVKRAKQFISDLIDEIVGAIPDPKTNNGELISDEKDVSGVALECKEYGGNDCRETLIKNLTK